VEAVGESLDIGPGLLEDVDDMLDAALPDHWAKVEGDEPLSALASTLLLPVQALDALRAELTGKARLAAGEDIGAIGEALGVAREIVVSWASALPVALESVRTQRLGGVTDPAELAAANRLPLALVA
jgi:hypothetical protein